ncbi:MAG: glycosyltransferase family 1 protein [Thermoanaerobaculia bacterium]|nr:glycosyltransferase family 1 protein [Thermoanaerobaculia bacterium]
MPSSTRRRTAIGIDLRGLVGTPTGIGYYTLALLTELARSSDLRLVGMAHRPPQHADELAAAGVEIEVRRAPSGVLWQQFVVPRRLALGDLDLFWSPLLTLPLDLPVPGVATIHDLTPLLYPETHRFKVRWSILPFLGRTLAIAARVVTDSEATARDLERYYPECSARLEVIYPGVDPIFRPASPDELAAIRRDLDMPDGYLLYSGTLEPRKNLDLLLDAWEAAREVAPDTLPLVLTGPAGWSGKAFFRRLESLGPQGVRWLGRLERRRLVEVMQAARWFVYPSIAEGFGLPVAEAMASGVPPIVSSSSSLPEIVGAAGLTIDPYDETDLAALFASLPDRTDEERDLATRAVERAARFSWPEAASELRRVFRTAASV